MRHVHMHTVRKLRDQKSSSLGAAMSSFVAVFTAAYSTCNRLDTCGCRIMQSTANGRIFEHEGIPGWWCRPGCEAPPCYASVRVVLVQLRLLTQATT